MPTSFDSKTTATVMLSAGVALAAPLPPVEPPAGETLALGVPAGGLAIAERVGSER